MFDRLQLFATPLSADNGKSDDIDIYGPDDAWAFVAARDEFIYVPGASQSINEVYAWESDRNAYYREMAQAMCAMARPSSAERWR